MGIQEDYNKQEEKIDTLSSGVVKAITPLLEGCSWFEINEIICEARRRMQKAVTLPVSPQINQEEAFKEAFDVILRWLQSALQPNVSRETLNHLSFSAKQAYEIHKKYLSEEQNEKLIVLLCQFPDCEKTL